MGLECEQKCTVVLAANDVVTICRAQEAVSMKARKGVLLSTDLGDPEAIPYFLWDEHMTVAEFRHRLRTGSPYEQIRLLAKLLREARDTDVWIFTSPAEVWDRWPDLAPRLGRRRTFWEFLLGCWKDEGLLERKRA